MTDVVEGTVNVSDPGSQPNQPAQGALQGSDGSLDVKAIAAEVANILKPELQKMNQSEKDKRFAKFEKFMEDLAKPEAAVEQPAQPVQNTQQGAATTAQVTNTAVQQNQPGKVEITDEASAVLLKAFGLDQTDPAVVSANALPINARIAEYAKIVERKNSPPVPSAVVPQSGEQTTSVIESAYKQEYANLKQGDYAGLVALKRKYREKGLNV